MAPRTGCAPPLLVMAICLAPSASAQVAPPPPTGVAVAGGRIQLEDPLFGDDKTYTTELRLSGESGFELSSNLEGLWAFAPTWRHDFYLPEQQMSLSTILGWDEGSVYTGTYSGIPIRIWYSNSSNFNGSS